MFTTKTFAILGRNWTESHRRLGVPIVQKVAELLSAEPLRSVSTFELASASEIPLLVL